MQKISLLNFEQNDLIGGSLQIFETVLHLEMNITAVTTQKSICSKVQEICSKVPIKLQQSANQVAANRDPMSRKADLPYKLQEGYIRML